MRFLVYMKMANASGMLMHHLTLEHPSNSVEELCAALNRNEFMIFKVFYRRTGVDGEIWWQDRGKIIINTNCIGKVQEFIDMDRDDNAEDNQKATTRVNRYGK